MGSVLLLHCRTPHDYEDHLGSVAVPEPVTPWIFPLDFFVEIATYPFRYDSYQRTVSVQLPRLKTTVPGTQPRGFEALRARAEEALHRR